MAYDQTYDLAKIGFQLNGIPGLTRLSEGNLRTEIITGQNQITVEPNESGSDAAIFHSTNRSYKCTVAMQRVGSAQDAQLKIAKEWANGNNKYKAFSASFRPTQGTVISSAQCYMDRVDYSEVALSQPDNNRVMIVFYMLNVEEI